MSELHWGEHFARGKTLGLGKVGAIYTGGGTDHFRWERGVVRGCLEGQHVGQDAGWLGVAEGSKWRESRQK